MLLERSEPGAEGGAKEAIVAHFHKASGEDMLEKTLHEFLRREGTLFELPGIGGAVLESNLGRLHAAGVEQADQATVAKSYPVDIGCQIAECRLSIAHRLAVHHPLLLPDVWYELCEEWCFA